jgi:predicted ester cyclase
VTSESEQVDARAAGKAIVRRHFLDGVSGHDLAVWDEIMAAYYQLHVGLRRDLLRGGRAGYQAGIAAFWEAFPDKRIELHELVAESDLVVARHTEQGRQRGAYRGRAPTGRSYTKHGFGMYRIADGLMAEGWVQEDEVSFARDLAFGGP